MSAYQRPSLAELRKALAAAPLVFCQNPASRAVHILVPGVPVGSVLDGTGYAELPETRTDEMAAVLLLGGTPALCGYLARENRRDIGDGDQVVTAFDDDRLCFSCLRVLGDDLAHRAFEHPLPGAEADGADAQPVPQHARPESEGVSMSDTATSAVTAETFAALRERAESSAAGFSRNTAWIAAAIDALRALPEHAGRPDREITAVQIGGAQITLDELAGAYAELTALHRDLTTTIEDRDRAQEAADALAYAVAPVEVIGEHGADDPWGNALQLLQQRPGPQPEEHTALDTELAAQIERRAAALTEPCGCTNSPCRVHVIRRVTGLAGLLGLTVPAPLGNAPVRLWSGYDDDYGIPVFLHPSDAKAYAVLERDAHYPDLAGEPVGWTERTARTDKVGYPDMWDMVGGNHVLCGVPVYPSLAAALADHPIERDDEDAEDPEPDEQILGQIALGDADADAGPHTSTPQPEAAAR